MTTVKRLGVFMDHTSAHLIEFNHEPVENKTITSDFTHQSKIDSLHKSEHLMHNKEQHEQAQYYKSLSNKIANYNHVLLFGPTQAKTELLNTLRTEHRLEKVRIDIKHTDKMSENQQYAFVNNFFSTIKDMV